MGSALIKRYQNVSVNISEDSTELYVQKGHDSSSNAALTVYEKLWFTLTRENKEIAYVRAHAQITSDEEGEMNSTQTVVFPPNSREIQYFTNSVARWSIRIEARAHEITVYWKVYGKRYQVSFGDSSHPNTVVLAIVYKT